MPVRQQRFSSRSRRTAPRRQQSRSPKRSKPKRSKRRSPSIRRSRTPPRDTPRTDKPKTDVKKTQACPEFQKGCCVTQASCPPKLGGQMYSVRSRWSRRRRLLVSLGTVVGRDVFCTSGYPTSHFVFRQLVLECENHGTDAFCGGAVRALNNCAVFSCSRPRLDLCRLTLEDFLVSSLKWPPLCVMSLHHPQKHLMRWMTLLRSLLSNLNC